MITLVITEQLGWEVLEPRLTNSPPSDPAVGIPQLRLPVPYQRNVIEGELLDREQIVGVCSDIVLK